MKVYFAPQSRAVRTVWLLEEMGQPYELVKFTLGQKEMRGPDYTAINPNGRVPTLVDGDTTISESTAIAQYLAAKYAPALAPGPDAQNFCRIPAMAALCRGHDHATDQQLCGRNHPSPP